MKLKLSAELFEKGKSRRGSFSKKQFEVLGVPYPLTPGWYDRLIGTEFEIDVLEKFLALKDLHVKKEYIPPANDRWASGYHTPQCYVATEPLTQEIIDECPFDLGRGPDITRTSPEDDFLRATAGI